MYIPGRLRTPSSPLRTPIEPDLLDVQDLAAQREDRLELPAAALLGRATGALALDDEDLALLGIALLAVGELAG
jgi:hypothetical protein